MDDQRSRTTSPPPTVSVILAVRNGWQSTFRCLMAAVQGAEKVACETIVLDDASSDETRNVLPRLEGVISARGDVPVGRARSLAAGAGIARGRYLLFLSQECEPRPGWLAPLVSALEADPSLAAVGPVLVDASGAIESAGMGIAYAAPLPITPFPMDHGKPLASVTSGSTPALPVESLLVRADAFRAAGGFDERYTSGFEDLDLCFRLSERGGRLALVPSSVVALHGAPDWAQLGRHGDDILRLNRTWAGRFRAYTVDRRATLKSAPPRDGRPPISVVVPAHDALVAMAPLLEDLALNLGPSDEIVISDCGSSDGTVEFAETFVRDHPTLARIVQSDPAAGLAGAAQAGFATARRPLSALVHTAMSLAPGFFDDATELLARHPGAALAVPVDGAGVYVTAASDVLRSVAASSPQAFFERSALATRLAELGTQVIMASPPPVSERELPG